MLSELNELITQYILLSKKGDGIYNSLIFFWHRNGNLTYFNFSSQEKILKFVIFRDIIENLSFSDIRLCEVSRKALLPSKSLMRPVTRALSINTYGGTEIPVFQRSVAGMIERTVRLISIIKK